MNRRVEIAQQIGAQADHVLHNEAPATAAICCALIALARRDGVCGCRFTQTLNILQGCHVCFAQAR